MTRELEPSFAAAERTIARIAESGVLGNSERRSLLLLYLVKKELSGQGREIKAISIAMDVLGRDASFDPNTDSIVRSEIGRLRDALRLYDAEYADPSDMQIEIPKGTYRPVLTLPETSGKKSYARYRWPALFVTVAAALIAALLYTLRAPILETETRVEDPALQDAQLPYDVIRIALTLPEVRGDSPDAQKVAFGLNAELMIHLSAYPWLSIIAPVTEFTGIESDEVDYILGTEMFWVDETLETQIRLVTYPQSKLIWSDLQSINLNATALRKGIEEIASSVAFKLASNHGIAPELAKYKNAHNSPENLEAYLCYLGLHGYMVEPTDQRHLDLRNCLLQAVSAFPQFGDAWAGLALIYIDEARFRTNVREGSDPWVDADLAIGKALKFAPLRMPSLNMALINSVEAPIRDVSEFDRVSRLLLNLYPKHPGTLYNVGSRAAQFLGRWQEGLALLDEATELSPAPETVYFHTRAYKAAMDGTDEEALASVQPLNSTTAVSQLLLKYLASVRNDLPLEAEENMALLKEKGIDGHEELIAHVKGRRYDQPLESALVEQLENARLQSGTQ